MKKHFIKDILSLGILTVALVLLLGVLHTTRSSTFSFKTGTPLEITYKATSPFGELAGVSLPASCESGVWNDNGGYHKDGINSDPGTCGTPAPTVVDGACGSSNGVEFASAPTTGLCDAGTAGAVSGSGPWNWDCAGTGGGKTVSCSAKVQNVKNDPPNTPTISGDMYAVQNVTTSNWIEATDPESDDIFYELDWNCSGTVDGTTASYPSGAKAPIGHTYTTVGTYKVCGRAVQTNDTTKKSGWANYTIIVTDGTCKAPANACGVTGGTVVGGQCVAASLPGGYGNTCSSPSNSCGMTTIGIIGCDGSCSEKKAPSESSCPKPVDPVVDPAAKTSINDFRASPKLIAAGKTSRLYWDVAGDKNVCSITYTTNTNKTPVVALDKLPTNNGNVETTSIPEKRFYVLSCGAVSQEAIVSVYSLTEI